ncbi:hypothetical protein [Frankia sp. Cppng1_Ct_nod]|uniref:LuxE/PaaK family acyltransferase n=1 Tax=Frankia sp. Cppng1_Ct_nod TaxID=2897162 RepID=UPI0013EF7F1A|nr:hypothetical protein [Frankia sp. Cppng1_Ct_nod]
MTSLAPAGPLTTSDLPAVHELDALVFSEGSCFEFAEDQERDVRLRVIRDAVALHAERSPLYAGLVERRGFTVERLQDERDLPTVPVLPTSVFKRTLVTSDAGGQVVRTFLSSGTHGRLSLVPRDETTLQRLLGSVRVGLRLLDANEDTDADDAQIINLGPSRQQAGDIWFGYVMSLIEIISETGHYVVDGRLDLAGAAAHVARASRDVGRAFVVGPPVFVCALAAYLTERRISVDGSNITVITGGGWKSHAALDGPTFTRTAITALGLPDASCLRDAFNQVELNSVLMECAAGRKHAPPWLYPMTRNERLEPLSDGEPGLLSYLDPTAVSYPCFIVGDDLGRITPGRCPCGSGGRLVEITRRLDGPADAGCALKMQDRFDLGEASP